DDSHQVNTGTQVSEVVAALFVEGGFGMQVNGSTAAEEQHHLTGAHGFVFLVEHEARDGGVRSKGEDEIFRGQGGTDGDGGRELVVLLVELRRESGPAAGEAVLAGSKVIEAEAAVGTGDRLLRLLALLGECDGY